MDIARSRRSDEKEVWDDLAMKIGIPLTILCVSLFASSFPTLSKRVSFLRIPHRVFFIGKHFGTGVILSTAFVHLLQDAFETLLNLDTPFRNWVGLIVLCSLLAIFLVEYASMAYVERLETGGHSHHHFPSSETVDTVKPNTHYASSAPYTAHSLSSSAHSHTELPYVPESQIENGDGAWPALAGSDSDSEYTALLGASAHTHRTWHSPPRPPPQAEPTVLRRPLSFAYGAAPERTAAVAVVDPGAATPFTGHSRYERSSVHAPHPARAMRMPSVISLDMAKTAAPTSQGASPVERRVRGAADEGDIYVDANAAIAGADQGEDIEMSVSNQRKVVSILVLQLGIMLHSIVIGLTLSITSGSGFTSLIVAIIFHQLFEGLSLGVRIAALPHVNGKGSIMTFLKPTLAVLFAITTPASILIGLLALPRGGGSGTMQMKLTHGLMSAISAGMLIYAACVEMLAGDFVMDPALMQGTWRTQLLAVVSLLAGMAGMAVIG